MELLLDRIRHLRVRGPSTALSALQPGARTSTGSAAVLAPPAGGSRPDLAALVASLVLAVRDEPVQPLQEPFHAHRAADGSLMLPWPQALDGLLPTEQAMLVRDRGQEVAAALGLSYQSRQVPGITYGGARRQHQVILVPASWSPDIEPAKLPAVELVVLG
jgi:hypothetical protein